MPHVSWVVLRRVLVEQEQVTESRTGSARGALAFLASARTEFSHAAQRGPTIVSGSIFSAAS